MAIIYSIVGIIFLVGGAYVLVEGASRIAFAFGISELLVGLTVVAIGTSAPELAITVASAIQQRSGEIVGGSELIIGNVVGSNIANIGLILGISAIAASVAVPKEVIRRDFGWLLGATVLVGLFALDSEFVFYEGAILMVAMVIFSFFQYRLGMEQSHKHAEEKKAGQGGAESPNMLRAMAPNIIMLILGVIGLAIGSNFLVEGATDIALDLGISEYIIGLTLVAVGTSLPELATSVIGSIKGEGELVVGNIIGSNIYNLLLVLASGALITNIVVPDQVLTVQIPLMVGLTFALYPIIRSGRQVHRMEGTLLLIAYAIITGLAFVVNPAG
jgi:cation:H+ antiporter